MAMPNSVYILILVWPAAWFSISILLLINIGEYWRVTSASSDVIFLASVGITYAVFRIAKSRLRAFGETISKIRKTDIADI